MEAIQYISKLVKGGRKIGIFSCEDPYNSQFHKDLYIATENYLHFVPRAAGRVIPSSLDLGLQAKGINAWGIFGHYGTVHGHEVCAAINALNGDWSNYGADLQQELSLISLQYSYNKQKSLKENVVEWTRGQYNLLLEMVLGKQKALKNAVKGKIIVFGGMIENSEDGGSYAAEILFSNQN